MGTQGDHPPLPALELGKRSVVDLPRQVPEVDSEEGEPEPDGGDSMSRFMHCGDPAGDARAFQQLPPS
jgi:hypothetical protein